MRKENPSGKTLIFGLLALALAISETGCEKSNGADAEAETEKPIFENGIGEKLQRLIKETDQIENYIGQQIFDFESFKADYEVSNYNLEIPETHGAPPIADSPLTKRDIDLRMNYNQMRQDLGESIQEQFLAYRMSYKDQLERRLKQEPAASIQMTEGQALTNARVSRVDLDGVSFFHDTGVVFIPYEQLPQSIKSIFGYYEEDVIRRRQAKRNHSAQIEAMRLDGAEQARSRREEQAKIRARQRAENLTRRFEARGELLRRAQALRSQAAEVRRREGYSSRPNYVQADRLELEASRLEHEANSN